MTLCRQEYPDTSGGVRFYTVFNVGKQAPVVGNRKNIDRGANRSLYLPRKFGEPIHTLVAPG